MTMVITRVDPWTTFSASLARLLRQTPQDDSFGMQVARDNVRYVQFCAYGPGRLRCEVVSNEYLPRERRHTVKDLRWLANQGWGEPGDVEGQGSPNHYLDVDVEWADFAADMAVRVFRDLWGLGGFDQILIDEAVLHRFQFVTDESEQA